MPEDFKQAVDVIKSYCQNEDCTEDCTECPYPLGRVRCSDVSPDIVKPCYICDKNYKNLEIGDKVSLFGKIGEVGIDSGAYGIYFKEGIDWNLIETKIPEVTGCNNTPRFCYNDNFVSFWELMWNFNCCIEDACYIVEKI